MLLCTITAMIIAVAGFKLTSFKKREPVKKRLASYDKSRGLDVNKLKEMGWKDVGSNTPGAQLGADKEAEKKKKEEEAAFLDGVHKRLNTQVSFGD
mmetsp:Transcript_106561/g.333327  ORF Transcript_106561/g.333327 Transcript_106561/m.333327 type:complete len:96 (-) Transcript_106561:66-353(-)